MLCVGGFLWKYRCLVAIMYLKIICSRNSIKRVMTGSFAKRKVPMELLPLSCYNS